MQPKISIITAIYNDKHHIKNTIESILSQTYPNIEYIIIDGASTDGSVEVIQSYIDSKPKYLKHNITTFISQKDKGISDAFNKGIKLASGDYINFQGASDILDSNPKDKAGGVKDLQNKAQRLHSLKNKPLFSAHKLALRKQKGTQKDTLL